MGQERSNYSCAVAHKPDVRRVPQADAGWANVDLDGLCLAGFGVELHVREARARNDERVALAQGILGWRGSEEPDPSGRVGASVRNDRLPEQWFDNRASYFLCQVEHLCTRPEASAASEDGYPLARIDDLRRGAQGCFGRKGIRSAEYVGTVPGHIRG